MCGICGVVGFEKPERAQETIQAMMAKMVHRGPDDAGIFVDQSLALGMRRLSIIDLSGGHQPVFNEDHTLAAVFNGEIYNFQELRGTLESRGHVFRSCCDTEVIVHAFEEWGANCVDRLHGMFALAIADTPSSSRRSPRIFLARDRLGIKPLYYAFVNGVLVFASEVRTLLASGLIQPRLSPSVLQSYLLFGSAEEPTSLIDGVFSLPPGHRMLISADSPGGSARLERYWDFAEQALGAPTPETPARNSAKAMRDLLAQAVERHLIADVPLGIFLSSGIDSTALVALATNSRKMARNGGVHTLTIVFPEQEFSEAELARRTARHFRTEHREVLLRGEDMLARLDEAVGALDQPSMDGVNTYFVSWAARQAGLKVALSGLGGDEIFGGYSTFRLTPRAKLLTALGRRVPGSLRSLTASAIENFASRGRSGARQKLSALWREPDALPHPYFYTRLLFTPRQVSLLLNGKEALWFDTSTSSRLTPFNAWWAWLTETANQAERLDSFTAVSCLEARSYMVSTLLRDTDAMSMAHSLEVRVPFLDDSLVEFVTRLPISVKRSNGVPKALLVGALQDLLPREVVFQRKRTFTLPWERWLRGALRCEVEAEMSSPAPGLSQLLNTSVVRDVWTEFLGGRTSWSRVWSLFVLSRWVRRNLCQS